ncbi:MULTISPECIES: TIGR00266 family protein [Enterococcus]|uniref:TIGR00266 family protein n=1 Tax=Candidatus Enterococcus murrayae TaxID=2815321 RepID=A0ABS3HGG3_9ENTE|nr:TIGR00266 family protein [Enterococcus sp. MJM16]MBO0452545.1 TIGR00266 family protein [Enterococcus sp. MJM16]
MNFELSNSTFAPIAKVYLQRGEQLRIEPGAMVYELGEIELEGQMNTNGKKGLGGALSALGRSVTSGESFFISTATAHSDDAMIAIAPSAPGKIFALDVGAEHWRLNTGAFLASEEQVNYQMKRQKLSGALLGGTGGLFVMETTGSGQILVSAFGDIEKIELDGNAPAIIDNQHVIAWSSSLDYQIKVASGTFGFKTGEGVVNEFHGRGSVYIQTRNIESFANHINSFNPKS